MPSSALQSRFASRMIGVSAYVASFGLHFVDEATLARSDSLDQRTRIILSDHRYRISPSLDGKRVAIVGNGLLKGCGRLIDEHEVIVRVGGLRNWQRSPIDDGTRITTWAGHPWTMVSRNSSGHPEASPDFTELVRSGVDLWAPSPFHISYDAYRWLEQNGALDRMVVTPSPSVIYDMACTYLDSEEIADLFCMPNKHEKLIGLPYYDLLFTGTRLSLLLEMSGTQYLSIFGCDLFTYTSDPIWFGHDSSVDIKILASLKRRILLRGGYFYWHEEEAVSTAIKQRMTSDDRNI